MKELILSTLRLSIPLIFAAMGGLFSEKSGIACLCLEGVLLFSAFASATAAFFSLNPFWGLGAGILVGGCLMWVHGFLTQKGKIDHIISGIAVNLIAAGLTPLLCKALFDNTTNTPSLPAGARLPTGWTWICAIGILPCLVHLVFYHTRFGLRLRSAGEGPEALETAGVSTTRTRLKAAFLGGILVSFGGAYLSIAHSSQFLREMSAGRGFIALAAIIFGKWRPIPTFFSCLLFGFAEALQMYLQNIRLGEYSIPVQWVQALPYLIALLVLGTAVGASKPPRALGDPKR